MVAAIFLLVVMASLGAFMVTFANTQHLTSAQDVQGSRAYWAARSGLEWVAARINADHTVCPAPASFGVDNFVLVINCNRRVYVEGGANKTVFVVTSVASAGGNVGSISRIERSVWATMEF
jgi:MSHA biogenesis protein MshP